MHVEVSGGRGPEEGHPTEKYGQEKESRHLKKIEELRAIARNEHELLETIVQTLEQRLQQQKDRTDKFITDWQSREDKWRHTCQEIQTSKDQWEIKNQNRKFYIRFLADRIREAIQEAQETIDKAKRLIGRTSPFRGHKAQLVFFLEQARSQYGQIMCFSEANNAMLNYF